MIFSFNFKYLHLWPRRQMSSVPVSVFISDKDNNEYLYPRSISGNNRKFISFPKDSSSISIPIESEPEVSIISPLSLPIEENNFDYNLSPIEKQNSRRKSSSKFSKESETKRDQDECEGQELYGHTLYELLHPIFILGRILCVLPFTVHQEVEECEEINLNSDFAWNVSDSTSGGRRQLSPKPTFTMTETKKSIIRSILIKIIVTIHMTALIFREKDRFKKIQIMTWLWKLTLALFSVNVITILWTLQFQRNKWITLFSKSVEIHEQFRKLGLSLNINLLPRIFTFICIFHFFLGFPHVLYARAMGKRIFTFTNIIVTTNITDSSHILIITLEGIWLVTEVVLYYIAWTAFHFADTLRIALTIYAWILFSRFNRGLEELHFEVDRLHEVMSLHMRMSNLVGIINNLVSPLTFMGCTFFVFYACFYVNFILWGLADEIRILLFLHFILKNGIIFLVSADATAKAHAVSEWLERISTSEEAIPLQTEKLNKLIIFTAQVYHRDAIGFKGLQFFTISTSFFAGVVSLITTYTVVITQFISPLNATIPKLPGTT